MPRFVARLLSVVIPLLVWVSAGVSPAAAVETTPILLVVNDSAPNPFGRYLAEILRAEGLNSFTIAPLSSVNATTLNAAQLVVLAETPLSAAQAASFTTYITGGGRLLAMRPDAQIAALFSLTSAGSALSDPYLSINAAQPAGQGLPTATLQIHGTADRYTSTGTTLATLSSNATTATTHPAVALSATGRAAAFSYDLARNVVLTRQGNPANANLDTDGDSVLRTIDLFQSSGGGAPWVNRDRIPIPQADVQQRLFARLVRQLLEGIMPLPQLWYFPGDEKTMLILTGDAHANWQPAFDREMASINARNGKISLYLGIGGNPSNASVTTWRGQGHSVGIHPPKHSPPSETHLPFICANLAACYNSYQTWWSDRGFGAPMSRTVRNHQVAWQGWTDAADVQVAHDIAMDTNFYHWGQWIQKPANSWPMGYITGSGQPMKFARADGSIVPVYQQLTQLVDEQLMSEIASAGWQGLNAAQAIPVSEGLIDASLAGDYAAIMTQFHVDYYSGDTQTWAEGTMDYANAKGIPLWNADQWLAFTETRHDAKSTNLAWNSVSHRLSWSMIAAANSHSLSTLVPSVYDGKAVSAVRVDGVSRPFSAFTVNGKVNTRVSVTAGNHSFEVEYNATITTPTPTNTNTPTPTNTPTATNTPNPSITPTLTPTNAPGPISPAARPPRIWLPLIETASRITREATTNGS